MSEYIVSTCSTADMSKESMEKYDIKYAMFTYNMPEGSYKDDLYTSITPQEFYKKIMDGAAPTTSQVSAAEYMDLWEPYLKEGKDILHLTLSSGISGTYNSACIAQQMAAEKYPDRKVLVSDTLCASSGLGLIAVMARDNQNAGMTVEENFNWVEKNKYKVRTWFFASDLTCFIRGGRISKVAGTFGQLLNICPFMYVAKDGSLQVHSKLRGRKNAIKVSFNTMLEQAVDGENYSGRCIITHSVCYEDARALADLIEAKFTKLNGKVEIYDIGTVIGSHTGQGTVALSFYGSEKEQ